MKTLIKYSLILLMIAFVNQSFAQKPYRAGTTAATFLEIGYGAAGNAMGDAYVSLDQGLSSIYWNPAGIAGMTKNEAAFTFQPWYADINTSFVAAAVPLSGFGTLGFTLTYVDYGSMDVTTLEMQDGTGEKFDASDLSFGITFAKKLADWFSFGATAKYVSSSIWHSSASAMAVDLGVLINTKFFSPTGDYDYGMNIGMSISNYGTEMQYDGLNLLSPIDPTPKENGDYKDVPGQYRLQSWELPLIFRLGVSVNPIVFDNHVITLSVDALHPNNNSESVNVGAQYAFNMPAFGKLFLRGGYKGLFMNSSDYGLSFGVGVETHLIHNNGIKINYAFRQHEVLGDTHNYGIGIRF